MRSRLRRVLILAGAVGSGTLIAFQGGIFIYFYLLKPRTQAQVKNFKSELSDAATHDLAVYVNGKKFILSKTEIASWTQPFVRTYSGQEDLRLTDGVADYVQTLAQKTDQDPVDARFVVNASGSATIILPAQNGSELNLDKASIEIRKALLADASQVTLDQEVVLPNITPDKISSLGLNQLIATGTSNFAGSTASRIKNIKVSLKLYDGLIIPAHQTFSFNQVLGEVDATTGYVPEKVIENGKIEYDYGGGICQVSTTLFRAAVMAGFPILERKPHAFPVHYYDPQGFDATVYPGSSDLKFTNDTNGPVLIESQIKGTILTFQIYGMGDGRKVSIDGPHEYDVQPDGSMKAYLVRSITYADGSTKTDQINSVYKSPKLFPTEPNPYN